MAAMSAKTECDPKTVEVEKESLSTEEKSMFELYQSWRLDEEQPGIIQYMLDFGRNHLDLGPTELEIPETEAESMTQDINAPAAPEEPETLGRASIDKPLTRALGSIPEETREEVKQASNGRSQPERRVKPAMASRQIQKRSKSRPAAPVVKASAQTKETPQPSPPQQLEKDPQDEQNGQKDQTEEDARTVNGEGWIRLAPKIPSSMTPHSVPLQRQTTLQGVS